MKKTLPLAGVLLIALVYLLRTPEREELPADPSTPSTPLAGPASEEPVALEAAESAAAVAEVASSHRQPVGEPSEATGAVAAEPIWSFAASDSTSTPDSSPESGAIEVTVLTPSGTPVSGVKLNAVATSQVTHGFSASVAKGSTDARGVGRLVVPFGREVLVVVEADEYAMAVGGLVALSEDRPRETLELTLSAGGAVEGVLREIDGEVAVGVRVTLHLSAWPGSTSRMHPGRMQKRTTAEDGSFRFQPVMAGTYRIMTRVEGERAMRVPQRFTEIDVREGETTRVEFADVSQSFVQVSGLVQLNGQPLSAARVSIHWADRQRGYLGRKAVTDDEGRFQVTLDEGAAYRFQVSHSDWPGSFFQEQDVPGTPTHELVLEFETGRLAGRVLDSDGNPLASVHVQAMGGLSDETGSSFISNAETDEGGAYVFEHLLTATYTLSAGQARVRPPVRFRNEPSEPPANPFVGRGALEDVVIEAGGSVQGADIVVTVASAVAGVVRDRDGAPVPGAVVECQPDSAFGFIGASSERADEQGAFLIHGVPPGSCRVRAVHRTTLSPWVPLETVARETARVDLVVEPGTMLIISVRENGDPVKRCHVRLKQAGNLRVASGIANRGEIRLGPVLQGTYQLTAGRGTGNTEVSREVITSGEPELAISLDLP